MNKAITKEDLVAMGCVIYEQTECVVCLDAIPDTIFKPCLHSIMCSSCTAQFKQTNCPMCRKHVSEVIAIQINPAPLEDASTQK